MFYLDLGALILGAAYAFSTGCKSPSLCRDAGQSCSNRTSFLPMNELSYLYPSLFVAIGDSTATQIIRRQLDDHSISGENLDEMHSHLS